MRIKNRRLQKAIAAYRVVIVEQPGDRTRLL